MTDAHPAVTRHESPDGISDLCDSAAEKWRAVHQRLLQCKAPDREHIDELAIRISEALIGIETMLLI